MKITKEALRQIIKEELEDMNIPGMGAGHQSAAVQSDILRQIQELISQAQMNKSFGFHPKATQPVVDAVLELIQQLPQTGQQELEQ